MTLRMCCWTIEAVEMTTTRQSERPASSVEDSASLVVDELARTARATDTTAVKTNAGRQAITGMSVVDQLHAADVLPECVQFACPPHSTCRIISRVVQHEHVPTACRMLAKAV